MNKEVLNAAYTEIESFRNKFGETFYDATQTDDMSSSVMATGIISIFSTLCRTEKEFEIADEMLIAICGFSFENLVEQIKERDQDGYEWESFEREKNNG